MKFELSLAWRYLSGRKLRSFLTTLAIVFGVLVIFGMNLILPTMIQAMQMNIQGVAGKVDFSITHSTGASFPLGDIEKLKGIKGIAAYSASLDRNINLPAGFIGTLSAVSLVGIDTASAKNIRSYPIEEGRFLADGDGQSVLISRKLADILSIKVGEKLSLPTTNGIQDLSVVGIMPTKLGSDSEKLFVPLSEAQAMLLEPGRVNMIEFNIADPALDSSGRDAIAKEVQAALGDDFLVGGFTSGSEFLGIMQLSQAIFNLFGALALFMGAFIIFNTFRTQIAERRRDIGMLRALGASRRSVIATVLFEGLIQGAVGSALGIVLGYLFGAAILSLTGPMLKQFLNVAIAAPQPSIALIAISFLLGIGVTLFAVFIPARAAGRVTPLEALRPTIEGSFFKKAVPRFIIGFALIGITALVAVSASSKLLVVGAFMFLAGLVLVAPLLVGPLSSVLGRFVAWLSIGKGTGVIARSHLSRQPSRVSVTASTTMIGLAIIVAAGGVVSSLSLSFDTMLRKSLGSDYILVPPAIAVWSGDVGASPELASKLAAIEGVDAISTIRFAPSRANDQGISVLGIDPLKFPKVAGLLFNQGDEGKAYSALASGRTLIANGAMLSSVKAKVGDKIAMSTPKGPLEYLIVASASDLLNVKVATAYLSQANLAGDFGKTEDLMLQFNLKPGSDTKTVDREVRAIASQYPQFTIMEGGSYYRASKEQFEKAFVAIYALFAFLALPSLLAMLNTLTIGIIERRREIGMIRAVGGTRKQIRGMVVAEGIILASIGVVLGLLGGLYLGASFVVAAGDIFPMAYSFPVIGLAMACVIGILFGLIASSLPARQAARLKIVEALRYE